MEELIKQVVTGLQENVLRHQLALKEAFNLEWCWREEPNRGNSECTILAHVPIEINPVSFQSKKHLHWKALDTISNMKNETKITALAHNLLLKKGFEGEDRLFYKNMNFNAQASFQATRKKCFTPLDLEHSQGFKHDHLQHHPLYSEL